MRKRKKKTPVVYWKEEQENAILVYNSMPAGSKEREKLFNEKLYHPLYCLCEAIYQRFKFENLEFEEYDKNIKDALSFVASKLHMFNPERLSIKHEGKKARAFAYLSTIVKHYYTQYAQYGYRRNQILVPYEFNDKDTDEKEENNWIGEQYWTPMDFDTKEYYSELKKWWAKNYEKVFFKPKHRKVAKALIRLMGEDENIDYVGSGNRSVFEYLRDKTSFTTVKIAPVLRKIKSHSLFLRSQYIEHGEFPY